MLLCSSFFTENRDEFRELSCYFEHTWLERSSRERGNHSSLAVELCKSYELQLAKLPSTTSAVEGWHRGFHFLVQASHPTLSKLIESFWRTAPCPRRIWSRLIQGVSCNPSDCAIYKVKKVRLSRAVAKFRQKSPPKYLNDVAQNLEF